MDEQAAPRAAGIRRNTAMALGAELTTGALTAVLTLYLARTLGPERFGLFGLAIGIGALILLPADLGISQAAARFLAERRGDRSAMASAFSDALALKLAAAALFGGAMFALAGPVAAAYDLPGLTWPLRAMAVAVFAQSLFMLLRASFEAVGRMSADWRMVGGESLIEVSASVLLVALGGGAAGAAWGRSIGYAAGAALGLGLVLRMLGRPALRLRATERPLLARMARYGLAVMVIDAVYSVYAQIDVLLVGAILGASAAGVFSAPLRLVAFLGYPAAAITAGVAPRLARGTREEPDAAALVRGLRALVALQALALAPLLVWAEPITRLLLGDGYGPSAGVLRALVPFIFLAGPTRLLTISVNYLGEARRRIVYAVAALALNAVLDLVLIERIGVVGAAVGNDVGFAVYAFGHLYICRQLVDLPLAPLLASLLRGAAAAGAMALVLLAFGTGHVALPLLVLGLLLGTVVFAAVLRILREPLLDELAGSLPGPLGRLLGRTPGGA